MKLLQMLQTGMRVDTTQSSTCRHAQKNLYIQMKMSIFHLQTFITWWKNIFSSLCFNSAKLIFRMNKNIDVSEKKFDVKNLMWNFLMIIIFWSDFLGVKIFFGCKNQIYTIPDRAQKERVSNIISSWKYLSLKIQSLSREGIYIYV